MSPGRGREPVARATRPPADLAERAWTLMRDFVEAQRRHDELADALGFGLGAGRGRILFGLRAGPRTFTELAEVTGFDAPYTTLVVDRLESRGLVERRPHPDDRRRKLVALTAAGRAAVATADAIRCRPPEALALLSQRQLAQLTALLGRLGSAPPPETPA